jgi:hypothetical protein
LVRRTIRCCKQPGDCRRAIPGRGYCQYPGRHTQLEPCCTHCPGTQVVMRWGGCSQRPGTHCQPLFQVQYPGTQTISGDGAMDKTSWRGGGGACDTVVSRVVTEVPVAPSRTTSCRVVVLSCRVMARPEGAAGGDAGGGVTRGAGAGGGGVTLTVVCASRPPQATRVNAADAKSVSRMPVCFIRIFLLMQVCEEVAPEIGSPWCPPGGA